MQVYKVRVGAFKEMKKQMLLRTIRLMLIAVTAGIVISSTNSSEKSSGVTVLPFIIPFMAVAVGVGIFRGVNRQKAVVCSYTLTITNNLITREQFRTPTISIYFNEIREIAKHKNGGFTIKGKHTTDLIAVPFQIENYRQLEARLQEIHSIVIKDKAPFLEQYPGIAGLVTIGLMVCVYAVSNKFIVTVTGTALIALMVWSFIKIRTSKNIDSRIKRLSWWVLVVLASVIAVMIFKLTGIVAIPQQYS